jgi:hypothetical protein
MARFIKHVGQDGKGAPVVVVFREVPNDSENCLIVRTTDLPELHQADLIKAVESVQGQDANDIGDFLHRQKFNDGTDMLSTIHAKGWLIKVPTKHIVMIPSPGNKINLEDLNKELKLINRPKPGIPGKGGVATRSGDIANDASSGGSPGVLDDDAIAAKLRSQATTFEAEAKRLRAEAEELIPSTSTPSLSTVDIVNEVAEASATPKRRGRPKKASVEA